MSFLLSFFGGFRGSLSIYIPCLTCVFFTQSLFSGGFVSAGWVSSRLNADTLRCVILSLPVSSETSI